MAYDSKAVKLPKTVKRAAASFIDPHARGEFIKSFVKILEAEAATKSRGPRPDKK